MVLWINTVIDKASWNCRSDCQSYIPLPYKAANDYKSPSYFQYDSFGVYSKTNFTWNSFNVRYDFDQDQACENSYKEETKEASKILSFGTSQTITNIPRSPLLPDLNYQFSLSFLQDLN